MLRHFCSYSSMCATITKEDMRFVDSGYELSSSKKKGENYNLQQV